MFMNIMTCDRRVDRYTLFNRNRAVTRFVKALFLHTFNHYCYFAIFTAYLSLSVPLIALTE